MSENEVIPKKLFLFIVIFAAITFFVGLILLCLGYNLTFCEFFYYNEVTYAIFSVITYMGDTTFLILVIVTTWYIYDVTFAKNLAMSLLGSYYTIGIKRYCNGPKTMDYNKSR